MSAIIALNKSENLAALINPDWHKGGYLVAKDARHRLTTFAEWLDATGQVWYAPDLAAYRDKLLREGKKPASVAAHLSTIRGRYAELVRSNATRTRLYAATPADAAPSDRKALVDEWIIRLENATHPKASPVKVTQKRDTADSEAGLRLTRKQANTLLRAPGLTTLKGLRDSALIALMLSTGIREAEAAALTVDDLRQQLGGALALRVREGKGRVQRLIPYGELDGCLAYVDTWLRAAGIASGAVFRGFYKGEKHIRSTAITARAIQLILSSYPIALDGSVATVAPHDLRRTYARRLYEAHVDILAIQQNLGHADHKTTLRYIGVLDVSHRQPPAVYDFELNALTQVGLP